MDGLQNLTASPVPLMLDGREYQFSPLTLAGLGELEREVCRRRLSPLDALADCINRFSPEQQALLIDRAIAETARLGRSASRREIGEMLGSFDGICFLFYLATRDNHQQIDSVKAARELLSDLGPMELKRLSEALTRTAGLEALEIAAKNSPARTEPKDRTETSQEESRGKDSTENLAPGSDSHPSRSPK